MCFILNIQVILLQIAEMTMETSSRKFVCSYQHFNPQMFKNVLLVIFKNYDQICFIRCNSSKFLPFVCCV